MKPDSLIHLRVPAATKGRWIRLSRAAGMRLTDWIVDAVEAYMRQQIVNIRIPDNLDFSDLKLSRDSDGAVSFNWSPIEQICQENKVPIEILRDGPEDNVSGLIWEWYRSHRANGGEIDPVQEDLINEVMAEERAGQDFSHNPGTG